MSMHGLDWIGLDWIGLDWIGLDWIGLDWIGLDWIGLDAGHHLFVGDIMLLFSLLLPYLLPLYQEVLASYTARHSISYHSIS
jgi:hypothetical protein